MKQAFLYSSALTAVMLAFPVPSSHAAIVTTTTTTYTYEFPESKPTTTTKVATQTDCPVNRGGGGGGGGSGGGRESYRDTDGDGVSDTRTSGGPGQMDGYGGKTTTSNGAKTSGYGSEHYGGSKSGSSSSGGSSRVICTYFYQKGELDAATYYADMEYTRRYLNGATVRGYHFWAVPYARALRQAPGGLLEKIIRPVTIHRARELAYQMGVEGSRPNYLGKFFRWTIEPVCSLIGHFVSEGRWEKLYSREEMHAYAMDYALYQSMRDYESQKAYHTFVHAVRSAVYAGKPAPSRYL